MAHKYNTNDKYGLYNFLIQNGFEALQKPELLESSIPGLNVNEVKAFMDAYKKNGNSNSSNTWISNILNMKQHYKHEAFYNLMADVVAKKADTLSPNDQYREVYQFLATTLKGEFPKVASLHTAMVVMLLMQDLNRIIQTVNSDDLYACLTSAQSEEGEFEAREELRKRLMSLFKFQRINEFINPLGLSSTANEKVHQSIFKP